MCILLSRCECCNPDWKNKGCRSDEHNCRQSKLRVHAWWLVAEDAALATWQCMKPDGVSIGMWKCGIRFHREVPFEYTYAVSSFHFNPKIKIISLVCFGWYFHVCVSFVPHYVREAKVPSSVTAHDCFQAPSNDTAVLEALVIIDSTHNR